MKNNITVTKQSSENLNKIKKAIIKKDISEYTIGVVKWYNEDKKYGIFLVSNTNEEIFFYYKNWSDKKHIYFTPYKTVLIFKIGYYQDKTIAQDCRYFDFSINSYKLLYSLSFKTEKYLYINNKFNQTVKIFDLLYENIINIEYFQNIISVKLSKIRELEFTDKIKEYNYLFGNKLINKSFIEEEALKKFKLSKDKSFQKELLSNNYIPFDFLNIKTILEFISINKNNFIKLKEHTEFKKNIIYIFPKIKDIDTFKELIFIALRNNIEETYQYISQFICNLSNEDLVNESKKLLDETSNKNLKTMILVQLYKTLKDRKSNKLYLEAYTNKLIPYKMIIDYSIKEDIKFIMKLIRMGIDNNEYSMIIDTLIPILVSISTPSEFIIQSKKLLEVSNNTKFKEELLCRIELITNNNYNLTIEAFNNNLTNISRNEIFEIYIKNIDLKFFKDSIDKIDISNFIIKLLKNNDNQEVIKYIIIYFETFNLKDINYKEYFNIGKQRLIYFIQENQVIYLKKLFHLKKIGKLNFLPKELNDFITPIIIKLASKENKNIDFSTFLIIDLIVNFDKTNNFIGTHGIIKNVLNILTYDKTKKLKIGEDYFDKCDGQAISTVSPNLEHTILKDKFTTSQGTIKYYFKVKFPYNEEIINDIKKMGNIKTRKYNIEEKSWSISIKYENEVFKLANKYNFLLKLNNGKSFVENNPHIETISKKEKPIGIKYCCGQKSQKRDNQTSRVFWWCNGVQCFENNIKNHSSKDWINYTLYDFMNILNLSLVENSKDGNFTYSIGKYSKFVAFINRFDILLDRLYCKECKHILYPEETSNFHKFSVTNFQCKNDNCIKKDKKVYLNNCLNGQCNEIIDSRESEICPNGWRICTKCGSCCSHITFERRLKNLGINGGEIYELLIKKIETKAGHLEKAEYFCYQCGQIMIEYNKTMYRCKDCNIEYDLSNYSQLHKKYIHLYLKDKNYPNIQQEIIIQLKQVLLKEKKVLEDDGRSKGAIFGIIFNKDVEIDGTIISLATLNNRELTNEIFN